jgi:hypothetical protein
MINQALLEKDRIPGSELNKLAAYFAMMFVTTLNGPFLLSRMACDPDTYLQQLQSTNDFLPK